MTPGSFSWPKSGYLRDPGRTDREQLNRRPVFATIVVAFFLAVIASYNDDEALAKSLFRFIVILLITGFAFNVATFSVLLWHGWSNRPNLPSFSKDEMLFDEKSAGGYYLLSWHTRRFPAKNGIHVSIARDQLWIRPRFFAFVSIGLQLDQVH